MRTLIIDNYDSFTFNLFQMIATINGEEPIVVRNDQITWETLTDQAYDNIVISPGPGTPERATDVGICMPALRTARVPILGVCLGHQALGVAYGATVSHAPEPIHGRRSALQHDQSELWDGIPQGVQVVRYHSLMLERDLPPCLEATAWTPDGIVMGIRHRERPLWGVQFHPESICTEYGERLLLNFRELTHRQSVSHGARTGHSSQLSVVPSKRLSIRGPSQVRVKTKKLGGFADPPRVFQMLFADESLAFWLDSNRAESEMSRFSFMGSGAGPNSLFVSYQTTTREVTVVRAGVVTRFQESIYDYLERELASRHCQSPDLPFDFNGGFVGYFGYELKAESGASHTHQSKYPDAMFLFADRFIGFDHEQQCMYMVCVIGPGEDAVATAWFEATEQTLRVTQPDENRISTVSSGPIGFRLSRSRRQYLDDIERCKRALRDGESYELCLTNQLHITTTSTIATYLTLRRVNPAPYSAFLRFGELAVMSSSPERFLRIDQSGWVESKPIKGTRRRGETPDEDARLRRDLASNEKERSENLMITDLVRSDLGIVCEIGSVSVPMLMVVESYQTVHQLVSTVRGKLRPGHTAITGVRHTFPGGSMTGAPKLRTMNILDDIEVEARGVYSGAIGFLGVNGTADLSIVIRTLVATGELTTIGIGGAIVMLSDSEQEFDETMVKARVLIQAVVETARGRVDPDVYQAAIDQLCETGATVL